MWLYVNLFFNKTLLFLCFTDVTKPSSPDPLIRENKEIVRKRRPINFSLNDLDDDETGDDTWNATPKATKNGFTSPPDSASIGSGAQKTRMLPRRSAASKIKFDEDVANEETDEDDIFDPNPTPAMKKRANSGVEKVFIVLFKFCFSFDKLFSIVIGWFGFLSFLVWNALRSSQGCSISIFDHGSCKGSGFGIDFSDSGLTLLMNFLKPVKLEKLTSFSKV